MDMLRFAYEQGALCLFLGDDKEREYRELGFCFDRHDGTLRKYGEADATEAWANAERLRLSEGGHPERADALVVASSDEWDEDLINDFLNEGGEAILAWWRAVDPSQGALGGPAPR